MATAKQIEANRQNALKSTGPKTTEGKSASRLNAVTHGLAASLPEAFAAVEQSQAELDQRKAKWRPELRPEGDYQESLFEQIVVEAIRVDRCQKTFLALCTQHAQRARVEWDADRRRDAATLAAGLARNPQLVAERLAATPHGCDLMLGLWRGLRASLDRHKSWTDNQRSLALDLLGIHPDLRDAETPIDPSDGDAFETRLTTVDAEIARLSAVRERTLGLDESERDMAEQTLGVEFTRPVQLLDRYERNAFRRQQLAFKALKASQRGETVETKPIPPVARAEPKPEPRIVTTPPTVGRMSRAEFAVVMDPVVAQVERESQRTHRADRPTSLNRRQRRKLAALERRAG
jgi:hypothetical protein